MATSPNNLLAAGAFALAALGLCNAPAFAAPESNHPKAAAVLKAQKAKKATSSKSKSKKAAAAVEAEDKWAPLEEAEPDITDTKVTEYNCELNNKVTIYSNEGDDAHIALRWKKRLHRLERVGTTTGAKRFENTNFRLIWIGIPSKGLLLDSRLNRQLANECKSAEQDRPVAVTPVVAAPAEAPPVVAAPVVAAPAEAPPVVAPPVVAPPVEAPPVVAPPAEAPPVVAPPVEAPPVVAPPVVVTAPEEQKI